MTTVPNLYFFVECWKWKWIFPNISSNPAPFAYRYSLTNHIYQTNWGVLKQISNGSTIGHLPVVVQRLQPKRLKWTLMMNSSQIVLKTNCMREAITYQNQLKHWQCLNWLNPLIFLEVMELFCVLRETVPSQTSDMGK